MTKKLVPELKEALNRFNLESSKDMKLNLTELNDPINFSNKKKLNSHKVFPPS